MADWTLQVIALPHVQLELPDSRPLQLSLVSADHTVCPETRHQEHQPYNATIQIELRVP